MVYYSRQTCAADAIILSQKRLANWRPTLAEPETMSVLSVDMICDRPFSCRTSQALTVN